MNPIKLLTCLFIVVFLAACRDKNKDDIIPNTFPGDCGQTVYSIDSSLMRQFLFKAGTYWVYKDSVTGKIDSCYCFGPKIRVDDFTSGRCNYYSRYAFDSTNFSYTFQYIYYLHDKYIYLFAPTGRYNGVVLSTIQDGKLNGDSLSQYYTSITINTVLYSDVHKFHFKAPKEEFKEGYFYMKPGVGMIKTEFYTKDVPAVRKVFELVSYHVQP